MSSAAEPGQFMIKFSDVNESNPLNVFSKHTNEISGGAKAAPTGATYDAIPYTAGGLIKSAQCRGRILVYFKGDATDINESEESQWEIPMLILDDATGQVVDSLTLTQENMTGFTQAGTVDVTCTALVPARLAYYDVPRGLRMALDPRGKVRAYIGDDS